MRTYLVTNQAAFLQDAAKLITFAQTTSILVTGGELYRTPEQQALDESRGLAPKHCYNTHGLRLAIDLNFFLVDEDYFHPILDPKTLEPLGVFWTGLNPLNQWGGNWKSQDLGHFERRFLM
jgi:hypothetical protein